MAYQYTAGTYNRLCSGRHSTELFMMKLTPVNTQDQGTGTMHGYAFSIGAVASMGGGL